MDKPPIEEKTREEVEAERKAKRAAKQERKKAALEKQKIDGLENQKKLNEPSTESAIAVDPVKVPKPKADVPKTAQKKQSTQKIETTKKIINIKNNKNKENIVKNAEEVKPTVKTGNLVNLVKKSTGPVTHKVKLFNHLYIDSISLLTENKLKINSGKVHPSFIKLGVQMRTSVVAGSNARCLAFLYALKQTISDFVTPEHKNFARSFEEHIGPAIDHLMACRPFSVSMNNAHKSIMWHVKRLPHNISDGHIHMAGKAICIAAQNKIAKGDVILTYGYSSLIERILTSAHSNNKQFSVIVVDSAPWYEGRQLLHRLVRNNIQCTYVLLSATSFIMTKATKVLLGAHALLANGYVMGRAGSSQIALVAKHFNVPVLVCCETYKFTERVQTDSIVFNELGNENDVMPKEQWLNNRYLTPLGLRYDVTTSDLITAVVTEIAILPCTSVPVVLRVRPN
ncbi:translation initiation factor eIF-2B subunit delta isoform X2 [Rhopalosiphum maidis]|uniref:translation initiation factor eIF-2B subunit delta isoform X2 n=1 Tax=Rhopalosiphum maidis TaxID=43146 RepID=UPI000EFDCEE6|nr:translation initiation factor eIF-2B subunit delta isoform X2 [Rhopalosiphum maidis]